MRSFPGIPAAPASVSRCPPPEKLGGGAGGPGLGLHMGPSWLKQWGVAGLYPRVEPKIPSLPHLAYGPCWLPLRIINPPCVPRLRPGLPPLSPWNISPTYPVRGGCDLGSAGGGLEA